MGGETQPSPDRRKTMITIASNERLIAMSTNSQAQNIVERVLEELEYRLSVTYDLETEMARDFVRYRLRTLIETNQLEGILSLPADEAIALEEEVNIALFKPLGE